MATQPLYQLYNPPAQPLAAVRSNNLTPLNRRAAGIAVQRATAEMPIEVREATLDEIAIAEQTAAVIQQARRSLTPECAAAFLNWGAAAAALSTESASDEESSRRLDVLLTALDTLTATRSGNMADLVFKTYVLALEATDSSCFGPVRVTNRDEDCLVQNLGFAAYTDIRDLDPLPEMLDRLGAAGWRLSSSTVAFTRSIGDVITEAFTRAIAATPAPIDDRAVLNAGWNDALAAYRSADALCEATPINDPEADVRTDACCAAMDHLIEKVRAPDLAALNIKLELAISRAECFEDVLFDDHARGIIADIRHLASKPMPHDPHASWLAERNNALREINSHTEAELSDDACNAISDYAIGKELLIAQEPARSERGVIAKLALLVQNNLEGHVPDIDECAAAIRDASRVCGIGSLEAAANARHREMVA